MKSEEKICPKCGTKVPDRFCPTCGFDLESIKEVKDTTKPEEEKTNNESEISDQAKGTENKEVVQTKTKMKSLKDRINLRVIGVPLLCLVVGIGIGFGFSRIGLSGGINNKEVAELVKYKRVKQEESDDNDSYVYLKDYKGLYVKDIGAYDPVKHMFYDSYSNSIVTIYFKIRADDGSRVSNENAQNYMVKSQNYKPNTEIDVDDYDYSYYPNEIELRVIRVK